MKTYAVLRSIKRVKKWHKPSRTYMKYLKQRGNRNYRHHFKQQINQGLEALSEFKPSRNIFITGWDIA